MAVPYYATYCRFATAGKREGAVLLGADSPVGDIMEIDLDTAGTPRAWLRNRFDTTVGYLDADMSEQVQLALARGMQARAILAAAYLTDNDEAVYWGEVVVMCFTPNAAFEAFLHTIASSLAEGVRPAVDLGKSGLQRVEETQGAWVPETRVPPLQVPAGTALLKDHATFNDRVVEAARQRNPGCLAAGWAFIVLLVVLAVWVVWRLVV